MTGPDGSTDPAPETEQIRQAPSGSDGSGGSDGSDGSGGGRSAEERARAIAVLDEPLDDRDLDEQIRRPGTSRSTKLLLGLLAAVLLVALGTFIGRVTAPDTGPGSSPDVVGTVESSGAAGSPLTVRGADGALVVLSTTPGTAVGVPRPDGLAGLRPGDRVTVGAEVDGLGGLAATRVDVTGR